MLTMTHRPRNVDSLRAGAILYGDWGTSKVYVIGLAFAVAGYASFWLILAVSLLSILIGINYITICKLYPNGGGVYASVRQRSPIISIVGACFLAADFLVTAALSALSAFYYFGVLNPAIFAAIAIGLIGALNFLGPRKVGGFVFVVAIIAVVLMLLLAVFSLPFLHTAWENIRPLEGPPITLWKAFVGVIVALSGVEAIANTTGVMKLDPGSTNKAPIVKKTAMRAILAVMLEVAILTSLFGFATAAISGFELSDGTVNAPGNPNVRDYMLRYLGEVFAGNLFGATFGHWFSIVLSAVIGVLLLTAVNTAINGMIALQYVMASDGEVPHAFQKLNRFGVPIFPLILTTVISMALVLFTKDIAKLAALYAIGFVGAIATNLAATSTNLQLKMRIWERALMFFGCLIMIAIEITLFIDKPHARHYALAVILVGLILRGLAQEFKLQKIFKATSANSEEGSNLSKLTPTAGHSILCSAIKPGRALNVAIENSKKRKIPLHVLFIREQKVISDVDYLRTWEEDPEAIEVFSYAQKRADPALTHYYYCVSDSKADMIAAYAMRLEVSQLYMSMPKKGPMLQVLLGNLVREVSKILPEEIELFVIP